MVGMFRSFFFSACFIRSACVQYLGVFTFAARIASRMLHAYNDIATCIHIAHINK